MKTYLYKISNSEIYNISNLLTEFTWSGTIEQAVRCYKFSVINSPHDNDIQGAIPLISIGDVIELYTENDDEYPNYLLFRGKVARKQQTSEHGEVQYTCYDFLHALSNAHTFATYSGTPESIALSIAQQYGLTIQYIVPTGINIGTQIYADKTYIEIINECYKLASESTGENYYVYMDGWGFCVDIEGKTKTYIKLEDSSNVITSTFEESMEAVCNHIMVYDDEDKFIGEIKDEESIARFGVYSKVYHVEKYVDYNTGAKKQLHGVDTTISFESIGRVEWWSGRMLQIWDNALGISGNYIITSDTHKWTNNKYLCELNLKFHSLADTKVKPTYY